MLIHYRLILAYLSDFCNVNGILFGNVSHPLNASQS